MRRRTQIAEVGSKMLAALAGILLLACGHSLAQENALTPIPYATEQVINTGDQHT